MSRTSAATVAATDTSALAADTDAASTADFIVAPGRTVQADGEDYGPGKTVSLDKVEGERLRRRGFFVDDDGSVAVTTSGPAVSQDGGVRVDEA